MIIMLKISTKYNIKYLQSFTQPNNTGSSLHNTLNKLDLICFHESELHHDADNLLAHRPLATKG